MDPAQYLEKWRAGFFKDKPGDAVYAGGTPNFNERTGQYTSKAPDMEAYKPAANASNTAWSRAWNEYNSSLPEQVRGTQAQSFTLPGYGIRSRISPQTGRRSDPAKTGSGNEGNFAYLPDDSRPKFFEQRATDWTGGRSEAPDYGRRDAFIDSLNQRLAQYQTNSGVYQGQGAPTPNWGIAPSYDIAALWSQAGDMSKRGFSNPFGLQSRS